jgi:hypothetical protein
MFLNFQSSDQRRSTEGGKEDGRDVCVDQKTFWSVDVDVEIRIYFLDVSDLYLNHLDPLHV